METSFSVTIYDKQINATKYEWKFGSVQILLLGDCIILLLGVYIFIYSCCPKVFEKPGFT